MENNVTDYKKDLLWGSGCFILACLIVHTIDPGRMGNFLAVCAIALGVCLLLNYSYTGHSVTRHLISDTLFDFCEILPFVMAAFILYLAARTLMTSKAQRELLLNAPTEYDIEADAEMMEKMKMYRALPAIEKLSVLQAVADDQRTRLGLSHSLHVIVADLEDVDTIGKHDPVSHTITLSALWFDGLVFDEAISTLIHECAHAEQHEIVRAFHDVGMANENVIFRQTEVFRDVPRYYLEMAGYKTPEKSMAEYKEQLLERQASQWAIIEGRYYIDMVEEPDHKAFSRPPAAWRFDNVRTDF